MKNKSRTSQLLSDIPAKLVLILITLFPFTSLVAQDVVKLDEDSTTTTLAPNVEELNLGEARRILKFGTNAAVLSVVQQAIGNKDERVRDDILSLFDAIDDNVRVKVLEYGRVLNIFDLRKRAIMVLENYNDNSPALNREICSFLLASKVKADQNLIDVLLEICQSSRPELQAAAISALAELAPPATVTDLIKLFKQSNISTNIRVEILKALGILTTEDGTVFLRTIASDSSEEKSLQNQALSSLGKIGDQSSLEIIKAAFTSPDAFRRASAISALTGYDFDKVEIFWRQALRDGYWRNRSNVLTALADKKIESFLDAYIFMSEKDLEQPVRIEAFKAIAAFGNAKAWDYLLKILENKQAPTNSRIVVVELLVSQNFAASVPALMRILNQEWSNEKSALVQAIASRASQKKDSAGGPIFEKMLSHPNIGIRVAAIRAIQAAGLGVYRQQLESMIPSGGSIKSAVEDALKTL